MANIEGDKWFCAQDVFTKKVICSNISEIEQRFSALETAQKCDMPIFMKTKHGYEYCKIIYLGSEQGAKKTMENIQCGTDPTSTAHSINIEATLQNVQKNQEKILSMMDLILKRQEAQAIKIDSITKNLHSIEGCNASASMPLDSPSKSYGEQSQIDSESSQKSVISNKSYVPDGLKKVPALSGRNELKHVYPVNRFIPNSPYEIRLIGVQILEACRKNREWLRAAENLKIRDIDESSMKNVRKLLVDGPSCARRLSRDLSSVIYGDEKLSAYIVGFDGKGGKNTRHDSAKPNERQIMPIDEENKMRKIYSFIDEIFERQAVWKELVSDPINQKGRETKVKLRSRSKDASPGQDHFEE